MRKCVSCQGKGSTMHGQDEAFTALIIRISTAWLACAAHLNHSHTLAVLVPWPDLDCLVSIVCLTAAVHVGISFIAANKYDEELYGQRTLAGNKASSFDSVGQRMA